MTAQKSMKDLLAGLIFVSIGLAFAYAALSYDLGTAFRMGPGYFPILQAFWSCSASSSSSSLWRPARTKRRSEAFPGSR